MCSGQADRSPLQDDEWRRQSQETSRPAHHRGSSSSTATATANLIFNQLSNVGLTEVPSELFGLKSVLKTLALNNNSLCSLPSDIARLQTLLQLDVRAALELGGVAVIELNALCRSPATSSRRFPLSLVCWST
jgi:Leucine-rich repeat (LRR) protein